MIADGSQQMVKPLLPLKGGFYGRESDKSGPTQLRTLVLNR